MKPKHILIALAAFPALAGAALAKEETGALACVTDKWDEKEVAKGHKLADWAGRCVGVPDDPASPKYTEDCAIKYEFMPDESWKASGTCTFTFPGGDTMQDSVEEGSHLTDYIYKITGGTGKYKGASGGGTYKCESLSETLCGGRFKGTVDLP